MKAMMSEKLRNILNNPDSARELQKQLLASNDSSGPENKVREEQKSLFFTNKPNNDHTPRIGDFQDSCRVKQIKLDRPVRQ